MSGRSLHVAFAATACLLWLMPAAGNAQIPGSGIAPDLARRPTVSPYINLIRRGGSTITGNYYGIVRPEIEARRTALNLQQQIQSNRQAISQATTAEPPATGHPAYFMNHSSYFMTNQRGGGTTGPSRPGITNVPASVRTAYSGGGRAPSSPPAPTTARFSY
jgi:hypothetical protein